MEKRTFSIKEAVSYGWNTTIKNFWFLLSLVLIQIAIGSTFSYSAEILQNSSFSFVLSIGQMVVNVIISIGIINILLKMYDGEKGDYNELFTKSNLFWQYLGAQVLYGLLVLAGFLLLIVPGFYWGVKYMFVQYLIIDKNLGIKESFHQSGELTFEVKWRLILFDLALFGIAILGLLALIFGIFVAIPVIWLAEIHVYRQLLKTAKNTTPEKPKEIPAESEETEKVEPKEDKEKR